jgi:N-alpha-acetyl-L-2,4-diaminobutyrate deacetylase
VIESPVVTRIDFDRPGRQVGHLQLPRSKDTAGWASLFIPILCVTGGEGPTVLVTGGNHGDEPEGQIACLNLARELSAEDVSGRVIVIPCLSPEASLAYTRSWPSGENFNRIFPGDPRGTTAQILADYLTRHLFPISDAVIDIHSGGRSMMCVPWSEMHPVEDPALRRRTAEMMLAWNADYSTIYIDVAGGGLLVGEAERQGKPVIGTELGGGGQVTAPIHRLAASGLRNVLRRLGVLRGEVQTRRSLGLPETVILSATEIEDYQLAPVSGLFETLVGLGEEVREGQPLGRIHQFDIGAPPVEIPSQAAGIVCTLRAIATTDQGDCVCVVAQVGDRSELI